MRISTAYQYQAYQSAIDQAASTMNQYQQQLTTGKRINQPSDDPYGTTISLNLTSVNDALSQYSTNLNYGSGFLKSTESALSSAQSQMQQAYSLAVGAANSTEDQNARNGVITQINQIQSELMNLGNSQGANNEYLFGGQTTNTQPFTASSGALTYNGDSNAINIQTGPGQTLQVNTVGKGLFDTAYAQLEQFKSDLASGNSGAISNTDIQNLQNSMNSLTQASANTGAVLQTVNNLSSQNAQRTTELTSQISQITDANYSQVVSKYSLSQTVYQAALQTFAMGTKLSLMDFLK